MPIQLHRLYELNEQQLQHRRMPLGASERGRDGEVALASLQSVPVRTLRPLVLRKSKPSKLSGGNRHVQANSLTWVGRTVSWAAGAGYYMQRRRRIPKWNL